MKRIRRTIKDDQPSKERRKLMIRLFACCGLNQSELWCLLTQSETQRVTMNQVGTSSLLIGQVCLRQERQR